MMGDQIPKRQHGGIDRQPAQPTADNQLCVCLSMLLSVALIFFFSR